MRIGVFDSGIGGKSIADRLKKEYPGIEIKYVNDADNVPYGAKSPAQVTVLTTRAIQPLIDDNCDIIVIACNTATATTIDFLRAKHPLVNFVGIEPMVKPAVRASKTGVIAILATPATLCSDRYTKLKERYAECVKVIEPDCSRWAELIENNNIRNEDIIPIIDQVCRAGADTIALACTHYHWIKKDIIIAAKGRAVILDPSDAVSLRVGGIISGAIQGEL